MAGKAPILGVCLGHQAIGEAFGGKVVRARHLMHGKTSSLVQHDSTGDLFRPAYAALTCTRFITRSSLPRSHCPPTSEVTARAPEANGNGYAGGSVIMGLRHRKFPIEGVQFHPESVLTQGGHQMIKNFLEMYGVRPNRLGQRQSLLERAEARRCLLRVRYRP